MKKTIISKVNISLALALCLVIVLSSSYSSNSVHAAFTPNNNFEEQNVMTDLDGATVNGTVFDISDYPLNENGEMQIITFLEYWIAAFIKAL